MRRHMWMHVGLIGVIGLFFGLSALGVTIPSALVYLVVLACPLMMVFMMMGMDHGQHESSHHEDGSRTGAGQAGGCCGGHEQHGAHHDGRTRDITTGTDAAR